MSRSPAVVPAFDAVIIAGGRAHRLRGASKPALLWNGRSLRDRSLAAVGAARAIAWVGDGDAGLDPRVIVTRERPLYGGPAAALAAGLAALPHPLASIVVVIAVDLPRIEEAVVALLTAVSRTAAGDAAATTHSALSGDGVIGIDAAGFRQPLLAAYEAEALETAVSAHADSLDGSSLRRLIRDLDLREISLPDGVTADIDTPEDAAYHDIALPPETEEPTP
ncbi:NTP transferase domain-containing protein [Leifsonia sp. YIM 134122]|uniref:NTP transferase domain-containing protein n=1 Tax=Leifsonia stereocauli TaxID=3134136 RepID=A0ABU9W0R7_9MICO